MWILPQIVLCERVVAIQSYDFTEMVQMIEYWLSFIQTLSFQVPSSISYLSLHLKEELNFAINSQHPSEKRQSLTSLLDQSQDF